MSKERMNAEAKFIEHVSQQYQQSGLPPMAGRILGRLLVAQPATQSSRELAEYLGASKGAISAQTQVLMQIGLIERSRRPGSRETWYGLIDDVWFKLLEGQVGQIARMGEMAEAVKVAQVQELGASAGALNEFRAFYAFYERRLPALIAEWREERLRRDRE